MQVQRRLLRPHVGDQNAAVVQGCVPTVSITGDSYRMRRHRDAIAALRPALTGRPEGGEFP
jgi:hypothetical protein